MKYIIFFFFISIALFSSLGDPVFLFDSNESVNDVLVRLNEIDSRFKPKFLSENVSAEVGEDIIKNGLSKRKGNKKSKRQSKHFVCTSCHNIEREDLDLRISDPQERLIYTNQQGLPFLQGTTFYGMVNKSTFYNDDYVKKYGDLVKDAKHSVRGAIQLCAIECSQGRKLENWELESILAYLWTIDLKMHDLILTDEEKQLISDAFDNKELQYDAVKTLRSKYLSGSPATFITPPPNRKEGYEEIGDPENGKLIYKNSCLHCHYRKKYSYLHLDDSKLSMKYLNKSITTYGRNSIYQVIRYGTLPMHGKRSYMPFYTAQKMSNQQVEDLRSYIMQESM